MKKDEKMFGRLTLTLAAALALVLAAACGGDSDDSATTVATTAVAEATTTTSAPPATEDHDDEADHDHDDDEMHDDEADHDHDDDEMHDDHDDDDDHDDHDDDEMHDDHDEDDDHDDDDHADHDDDEMHDDHDDEDDHDDHDDHDDEADHDHDEDLAVTDATGELVTLEAPAVRVVCLTGLCVDTMFVLGIKPVAANDLLHQDPAYWGPDENEIGPVSGSFFEPSLEDIAVANPDIVIGLGGVHDGLRAGLESIAPLFIVNPVGVDGMLAHIAEIGILLGMEEEAEHAVEEFEARLEAYVSGVTAKRSVMVVYGSDVNIGADTVCTPAVDAVARAAVYPPEFSGCDVHQPFPSFSVEQLLGIDPDVIFVQTYGFGPTPPEPVSEQLVDHVIWRELVAVQNGEVHEVDFFIWGTSRGINGTNFVLDEAMPKIYPEVFPAPLP